MNKQREIQTQIIVANIFLSEREKSNILSNLTVNQIADWTMLSEEKIYKIGDLCRLFQPQRLASLIAEDYAKEHSYNEDEETYYFSVFFCNGLSYVFSEDNSDLKQKFEETVRWIQGNIRIDFSQLSEGTVTNTMFQHSLQYYEKKFCGIVWKALEENETYPEVIASILGISEEFFVTMLHDRQISKVSS